MPPASKEASPSSRVGRARTPAFVKNIRGVKNWKEVSGWLEWRGIEDIECITPDQAGIARGKMMPSNKFTSNTSLALPSALDRIPESIADLVDHVVQLATQGEILCRVAGKLQRTEQWQAVADEVRHRFEELDVES